MIIKRGHYQKLKYNYFDYSPTIIQSSIMYIRHIIMGEDIFDHQIILLRNDHHKIRQMITNFSLLRNDH